MIYEINYPHTDKSITIGSLLENKKENFRNLNAYELSVKTIKRA
jgi:hypothetical protein